MNYLKVLSLSILSLLAMAWAQDASQQEGGLERPLWQTLPLINAASGEEFRLADLEGQVVFVEAMATWCSNCRKQLQNASEAKAMLAEDEALAEAISFVILSIEGNLAPEKLNEYAQREDFDFIFAVASADILRELVTEFGRSITNPPSTPHFVIKPDGQYTDLITGIEPAESIWVQLASLAESN
ncbi:MAG: SCO family protein [Deinococcales bacterium]